MIIIILLLLIRKDAPDVPTAPVKFGDFLIELTASGEIQAARSINVSAPRVRTNLQIVKIVPEGTIVKSGDFLIQFDTNELLKLIEEKQAELDIAQANMEKSQASLESNMTQLVSALENAQASYDLAKLRLDQMAFEAEVKVQEEKLHLKQAEINLQQMKAKIESQKKIDSAELTTLKLKIDQARGELDKAKEQLQQMTVTAPAPGLVVYQKIWKGDMMEKIKVGDQPWRGQNLIQLPDLSRMQVLSEISEVDIGKLKIGQQVTVNLDAFPEPTFTGEVDEIASLAHEKEGQNDIKVFDLIIDIDQTDPVLKPGMTAKAKILIEKIPQQTFVPIEAVFDKEGEKVLFLMNGKLHRIKVTIGKRNDSFVVVQGELNGAQRVALVDPTKTLGAKPSEKQPASLEMPDSKRDKPSRPRKNVRVRVI